MKEFVSWLKTYLDGTPGSHLVDVKKGIAGKSDADIVAFLRGGCGDHVIDKKVTGVPAVELNVTKSNSKDNVPLTKV